VPQQITKSFHIYPADRITSSHCTENKEIKEDLKRQHLRDVALTEDEEPSGFLAELCCSPHFSSNRAGNETAKWRQLETKDHKLRENER
jgi:hypothetical protein